MISQEANRSQILFSGLTSTDKHLDLYTMPDGTYKFNPLQVASAFNIGSKNKIYALALIEDPATFYYLLRETPAPFRYGGWMWDEVMTKVDEVGWIYDYSIDTDEFGDLGDLNTVIPEERVYTEQNLGLFERDNALGGVIELLDGYLLFTHEEATSIDRMIDQVEGAAGLTRLAAKAFLFNDCLIKEEDAVAA